MNEVLSQLAARLRGTQPTVLVVGLGYVGLPLCVELGQAGARVLGLDRSAAVCEGLNAGRSHIGDIPSKDVAALVQTGLLRASTDPELVREADAIVVCVPTPLRKSKDPDISFIVAAAEAVVPRMHPGQLLVLESTTYPGTTEEILAPMLRDQGLEPGVDVALAFSPERVDPSNPTWGIRNTPKVVGGLNPACTEVARALYSRTCDTVVPVSSPATAEMVKLLENIFRSVNIGLVNEFALICRRLGLDVWEVIGAAATKPFGFMPFRPGPGLGGHCIPVDPHYLAWKLRAQNFTARFVELADAVNSRMPEHVMAVLTDALNDRERSVRGSRVLVLGVAYKADVADVRESPAFDIITLLRAKGALVQVHDPLVQHVAMEPPVDMVPLSDEVLAAADCVLLVTDHAAIDRDRVLAAASLVIDTRNAFADAVARDPEAAERVVRI